jgi:hypothetical protein
MAKISTYSLADEPLQLSDRLIGTEAPRPNPSSTPLATRNFSLGELLQLFSSNFPAASLQAVLDTGNIATQNITLFGNISSTLITPDNIKDMFGNEGNTFQFLSKATNGINWVDLPSSNLQDVLDTGNTATQNIYLTGNFYTTLIKPDEIEDETSSVGIPGQVLTKTSTGIIWADSPSSYTAGLNDVLLVGNTATNDIFLNGDISVVDAHISGSIYDSNDSPGTSGQILSSNGTGTEWINSPSDKTFIFIQALAANPWIVNHNLNKFPSVTMVLSTGQVGMADVNYIDANNLTITFSGDESGKAYMN